MGDMCKCAFCRGSGEDRHSRNPCRACGGSGQIYLPYDNSVPCGYCSGSGEDRHSHNPCRVCGGAGRVAPGIQRL